MKKNRFTLKFIYLSKIKNTKWNKNNDNIGIRLLKTLKLINLSFLEKNKIILIQLIYYFFQYNFLTKLLDNIMKFVLLVSFLLDIFIFNLLNIDSFFLLIYY